jgi:hypothetical protein
MLVLSEKDVQGLLSVKELIGTLERAHVQFSTGKAVMPVRQVVPRTGPAHHGDERQSRRKRTGAETDENRLRIIREGEISSKELEAALSDHP